MKDPARATFPLVVHTLLMEADRWFMLRRANSGYLDGTWTLPGGHVQAGEGVIEAARRECREESGVVVAATDLDLNAVMPYLAGDQQGVNFIARAVRWEGEPRLAEPARFDDCCWADPLDLPQPLAPFIPDLRDMLSSGEWFREFFD